MAEFVKDEKKTYNYVKYFSIGSFFVLILLAIVVGYSISVQGGIALFIAAILLGTMPLSIYKYLEYNRFSKMEEHFPTFLEDFSESKKSGMTFPQAFQSISKTEYGSLSNEIKQSANQLSWNLAFPKVMKLLADRIGGSKLMKQSFTIINEAYNSGGDVAQTMDALAMNIGKLKQIEDERRGIMSQQVVVMYIIFFLFLGIMVGLYQVLIPMTSVNFQSGGSDSSSQFGGSIQGFGKAIDYCGEVPTLCIVGRSIGFKADPPKNETTTDSETGETIETEPTPSDPLVEGNTVYFKTLFFFMALIQAICTGVIAGEVGEGSLIAGVRHTGILLAGTVLVFAIFF